MSGCDGGGGPNMRLYLYSALQPSRMCAGCGYAGRACVRALLAVSKFVPVLGQLQCMVERAPTVASHAAVSSGERKFALSTLRARHVWVECDMGPQM